jgi:hypothetical protein
MALARKDTRTYPTDVEAKVPRLPLLFNSQSDGDVMCQEEGGSVVLRQRRPGQDPPCFPRSRVRSRGSKNNTDVRFTNLLRKEVCFVRTRERKLDSLPTKLLHVPLQLDERRNDICILHRYNERDLALDDGAENPLGLSLTMAVEEVAENGNLGADARGTGVDGDVNGSYVL